MTSGYLLDTHTWLWWHAEPERLPAAVVACIEDPRNTVYLSTASAWEISIKWSIGKLELPAAPEEYVPTQLAAEQMDVLPLSLQHALRIASLPLHHADPFDRVLIAQAQCEALTVLTRDPSFRPYDVAVLWE